MLCSSCRKGIHEASSSLSVPACPPPFSISRCTVRSTSTVGDGSLGKKGPLPGPARFSFSASSPSTTQSMSGVVYFVSKRNSYHSHRRSVRVTHSSMTSFLHLRYPSAVPRSCCESWPTAMIKAIRETTSAVVATGSWSAMGAS